MTDGLIDKQTEGKISEGQKEKNGRKNERTVEQSKD